MMVTTIQRQPQALALQKPLTRPNLTATALRFGYGPDRFERQAIRTALYGYENQPDTLGPKYVPTPAVVNALEALITQKQPVAQSIIEEMALAKTQAENTQRLALKRPLKTKDGDVAEAQKFVQDLNRRLTGLNQNVLTTLNGFTPETRALFNRYAAQTAPILFAMGYPEAVDHSADVAHLMVKEAVKRGANGFEALQAAMVGWLHDPKLSPEYSWSNLATHPAVATAIAEDILNQPELKTGLSQIFGNRADAFTDGVVDALGTNNDSKFVMDFVILNKNKNVPLAVDGLADRLPEAKSLFQQRFVAPSQGTQPPTPSSELLSKLDGVSLPTELRAIRLDALTKAVADPKATFQALTQGTDLSQLQAVQNALDADAVVTPAVKGSSLLAHHQESKAPLPALSLAVADQLLLSPHKILAAGKLEKAIDRVRSFSTSFLDNMTFLPKDAQPTTTLWARDLYAALMKAADKLTGNNHYGTFEQQNQNKPLPEQVQTLKALVEDEQTWKNTQTDYAAFNTLDAANQGKLKSLIDKVKSEYDQATAKSPVIFG